MSQVRFEQQETVRTTQQSGNGGNGNGGGRGGDGGGRGGPRGAPSQAPQKQDFAHEVGNALTQGSGPGGYLAVSSISSPTILQAS